MTPSLEFHGVSTIQARASQLILKIAATVVIMVLLSRAASAADVAGMGRFQMCHTVSTDHPNRPHSLPRYPRQPLSLHLSGIVTLKRDFVIGTIPKRITSTGLDRGVHRLAQALDHHLITQHKLLKVRFCFCDF